MSSADKDTEKKLAEMEKHLKEIYERATKDVGKAWTEYVEKANAEVSRLTDAYIKAKASGDQTAIREAGKALAGAKQERTIYNNHYQQLTRDLAENISHVNETAIAYINNQLPEIYSLNYNSVAKGVNRQLGGMVGGTSFDLVDQNTVRRLAMRQENLLPLKEVNGKKDIRWNVAKINSEVTQGIIQGEAMPKIAERLSVVLGMDATSAIRNARTTVTSAQNKGRMDMMRHARSKGVIVQKGWSAARDDRVRHSHEMVDGEFVDEDEPFSNGLMYPGDPNGEPEEVYNCRCSLIYKVVGFGDPQEEEDDPWDGLEEGQTEEQTEQQQIEREAVNIWGEPIHFDSKLYDPKWENSRAIVDELTSQYKTRLKEVRPGAKQAAGSVQISGTVMNISSKDPSVAYHEFAHTLAIKEQDKLGIADNKSFWKEVQSVRRRYMKETEGNSSAWISTYEHGSNDINEFMSEAFALSKMRADGVRVPDKYGSGVGVEYADEILSIIDKYFKKRR